MRLNSVILLNFFPISLLPIVCLSILFSNQSIKESFADIFSTLITSTVSSRSAVRRPTENSPIHDITSLGVTCNVGLAPATETVVVDAGSLVGSKLEVGTVYHKGPAAMYFGKAPGRLGWKWPELVQRSSASFFISCPYRSY
jgi:hypothetical protein